MTEARLSSDKREVVIGFDRPAAPPPEGQEAAREGRGRREGRRRARE
jgi:hypothetical protein